MPLDFPPSPAENYIYTFGTSSWKWTGDSWTVYSTPLLGNIGATGNTGATGPVGDYVVTFNGSTGAVGITVGFNINISQSGNTYMVSLSDTALLDGGVY
jgi:hypothetical protein